MQGELLSAVKGDRGELSRSFPSLANVGPTRTIWSITLRVARPTHRAPLKSTARSSYHRGASLQHGRGSSHS